jgi:hypothetical protein
MEFREAFYKMKNNNDYLSCDGKIFRIKDEMLQVWLNDYKAWETINNLQYNIYLFASDEWQHVAGGEVDDGDC